MKILRTATLDRASRKKDRSVSITFTTDTEQSSEQFIELDELLSHSGVLYFKSNGQLTKEELNALDSAEIENEGKSKSQRLRSVLFVLHKETNNPMEFSDYYAQQLEKIILHYRDQIPND